MWVWNATHHCQHPQHPQWVSVAPPPAELGPSWRHALAHPGLQVNVLALSICTREAYQSMRERKVDDGHIININRWDRVTTAPEGALWAGKSEHTPREHHLSLCHGHRGRVNCDLSRMAAPPSLCN